MKYLMCGYCYSYYPLNGHCDCCIPYRFISLYGTGTGYELIDRIYKTLSLVCFPDLKCGSRKSYKSALKACREYDKEINKAGGCCKMTYIGEL